MATVRQDFFLDPAQRLSEQERALMTAMLHDIVAGVATELGAFSGSRAGVVPPTQVADRLSAAGLIDRAGLMALLLRRSDEYRIAAAFSGHAGPRRLALLSKLVGDSDAEVAEAAMALVVARGRRRDGFGQPRLELSDLPPADAHALVHSVAAALADGPFPDDAAASAASHVIDRIDFHDSLDRTTARLVEVLDRVGRNDDRLVEEASAEGDLAIVAAAIARRTRIEPAAVWDLLLASRDGQVALVARMAACARPTAARLIADLATLGLIAVEEEISRFDAMSEAEAGEWLGRWRLPASYRAARAALDYDRG